MGLLLEASREDQRPCPVDGANMAKEIAHMLVIDRCPECSGVWLDGGELERMRADLHEVAVLAMARGLSSPMF
jgi:Zn-finger nucleic acid-binding protein